MITGGSLKTGIAEYCKRALVKTATNWPAKVCSLAVAIMLVVFHRMSVLETRVISTPLQVWINDSLTPASSYPRVVRVSLRGEANSIYPIIDEDIVTYLDLQGYTQEGSYRVPIQVQKNDTALGVEPLEISLEPMEVSIELGRKASRNVLLSPTIHGYPEAGYELVSYTLTPKEVMVEGPQNLLSGISEIATEPIDIGGKNDDFIAAVRIINLNPLLTIQGDRVAEFQGTIKKLIMIRSFSNFVIELRGLDPRFTGAIESRTGSIRLEGPQTDLEPFEGRGISLFIDCSAIQEAGEYTLPVQVQGIPAQFSLIRSEPQQANLRVEPRSFQQDAH